MILPQVKLDAVRLALTLSVRSELDLGGFPGNTIRSGLGARLRELVCVTKQPACTHCALTGACSYPQLFEAGFSGGKQDISGYENAPKPYILHFPEGCRSSWREGERLYFEMVLLGPAVAFVPHLVYAMRELGRAGLGNGWKHGKGRYDLAAVEAVLGSDRVTLYEAQEEKLFALPEARSITDLLAKERTETRRDTCRVRFVTPVMLRRGGKWIGARELEATHLIEDVTRRIQVLAMIYGEADGFDESLLQIMCSSIKTAHRKLYRKSQERYSARTRQSMPMDGLLGEMEIGGNWQEAYHLLQLGELLHIGKGATMGMGQYALNA